MDGPVFIYGLQFNSVDYKKNKGHEVGMGLGWAGNFLGEAICRFWGDYDQNALCPYMKF